MSDIAGKVTFGSTGSKTVAIGIAANDISFYPENSPTCGFADHSFQFSRTPGQSTDYTKALVAYDTSGSKILEFNVTGWGATSFTCSVTFVSGTQSFALVARP